MKLLRRLPHLGQRIVKTAVAVLICLLLYWLRGYRGGNMPTECMITAIICMQPDVRDTRTYAVNRLIGTLIGSVWGLLLLLFFNLSALPILAVYGCMALGVALALYTTVVFRRPDASGLAAIIVLCIVISYPDVTAPLGDALRRVLDVFIGTLVAVCVNVFRLPRSKQTGLLFFVRTKDLAPDRFSQVHPQVLFRLNRLHDDGARICLVTEHAPAFLALQMRMAKLKVPMIVMDGAAIYDVGENRYLHTVPLAPIDSALLRQTLEALGVSYFVYTVRHNKTCIFHHGEWNEQETAVLDQLKSSPYRSYLEGEVFNPDESVYFKLISDRAGALALAESLRNRLPPCHLRSALRPQAGAPGAWGLYLYSEDATVERAKDTLLTLLAGEAGTAAEKTVGQPSGALTPIDLRAQRPYESERDALHLLNQLERRYEPVRLLRKAK